MSTTVETIEPSAVFEIVRVAGASGCRSWAGRSLSIGSYPVAWSVNTSSVIAATDDVMPSGPSRRSASNSWIGRPVIDSRIAQALMASHLFDELGYRRYEWKCNIENAASKRAAERFGYVFEGVFRNDMVTKGRSRDTAWYSITDREWPRLKLALDQWLADANFATDGAQIRTLESFR